MPLLNGTQVSPLPLPKSLSKLSLNFEAWSIHQTGEIFLDYESYANRYIFYSQPIFSPNTNPDSNQSSPTSLVPSSSSSSSSLSPPPVPYPKMTFFQALEVENQHLDRLIHSYFPSSLKRRILVALIDPLSQQEPSIDSLVSHLYKIFHNRFDFNEKVIVDLSFNQPSSSPSTVYYANIHKVFPPKPVRDLDKSGYHDLIHLQTIERFKVDLRQALDWDDSKSYLYTIQLIEDRRSRAENGEEDQEDHFGTSYMEAEPRKLSRHPNTFSKSLLKRFIQSVLLPYSAQRSTGPRWKVSAQVLAHYQIIDPHNNLHLLASASNEPFNRSQKRVNKKQAAAPLKADLVGPPVAKKQKLSSIVHTHPPSQLAIPLPPPSYQDYLSQIPELSIPLPSTKTQHHQNHPLTYPERYPHHHQPPPAPAPPLHQNHNHHHQNHIHPPLPVSADLNHPQAAESVVIENELKRKKRKKKRTEPLKPILTSIEPDPVNPPIAQPLPAQELSVPKPAEVVPLNTPIIKEVKKSIKYPIEDLELDPLTVIDGRHLRKIGPVGLTSLLPLKPKISLNAGKKMGRTLKIWSFVNIFRFYENGLGYKFEDFEAKIDQIICRLIKTLIEESHLRYPNSRQGKGTRSRFSSMSVLPYFSSWPQQETEIITIDEREYWVRKGIRIINLWKKKTEAGTGSAGSGTGANAGGESGGAGQKKKMARMIEEDLAVHLLEIVSQRGGIERVGCLGRMMKYFFSTDGAYLKIDHDRVDEFSSIENDLAMANEPDRDGSRNASRNNTLKSELPQEGELESSDLSDPGSPSAAESESESEAESGYETQKEDQRRYGKSHQKTHPSKLRKILKSRFEQLGFEDKLMMAEFLSDLLMESDFVRNYMENNEEMLTVVRKEKADANKEKRKLLDELAKCEVKKDKAAETESKTPNGLTHELSPSTNPLQPLPLTGKAESEHPQAPKPTRETQNISAKSLKVKCDDDLEPETENGRQEAPSQKVESQKNTGSPVSPSYSRGQASNPTSQVPSPNISKSLSGSGTPYQTQFTKHKPSLGSALSARATPTRLSTLFSRQYKPPPAMSSVNEAGALSERDKLENQLFEIGLRELELNERFRQYAGVSKIRMLGYDRFYCRYWWFDGIGGMSFYPNDQDQQQPQEDGVGTSGPALRCYSGGIFVCGPCVEDLKRMEDRFGGKSELWKRRLKEELGVEENEYESEMRRWVLNVDEWGIYDQEDQIEGLLSWLNSKGMREMNLKQNIRDWKEYILDGIRICNRDRSKKVEEGTRLVAE